MPWYFCQADLTPCELEQLQNDSEKLQAAFEKSALHTRAPDCLLAKRGA